jgi:NADPH:quinone reductase-like Zn-dependent oxidoreductase
MRAYVLSTLEQPPLFTDLPVPDTADDQVLVRVTASSVNPHDASVASGAAARYMTYHFPAVLGSDLAGTVEAVGAGVTDLCVGDRVFGLIRERVASRGSFAELVAVPREAVTKIPAGLDDASAGALGLAMLTALRCVEAVAPTAGELVLVNGATGGVGSYVVQMLTALGAVPVATARPGEEEAHVRGLGATSTLDWSAVDLPGAVRALHPDKIAAVIDLVTRDRDAFTELATGVLAPGGRIASTNHAADQGRLPGVSATNVIAEADHDALQTLADLAGDGQVRAPITATFEFDELDAAFAALRAGALGKLAIRF